MSLTRLIFLTVMMLLALCCDDGNDEGETGVNRSEDSERVQVDTETEFTDVDVCEPCGNENNYTPCNGGVCKWMSLDTESFIGCKPNAILNHDEIEIEKLVEPCEIPGLAYSNIVAVETYSGCVCSCGGKWLCYQPGVE